jgi:hypothetical protein
MKWSDRIACRRSRDARLPIAWRGAAWRVSGHPRNFRLIAGAAEACGNRRLPLWTLDNHSSHEQRHADTRTNPKNKQTSDTGFQLGVTRKGKIGCSSHERSVYPWLNTHLNRNLRNLCNPRIINLRFGGRLGNGRSKWFGPQLVVGLELRLEPTHQKWLL